MLFTVGSKIGECDDAEKLGWGTEVSGTAGLDACALGGELVRACLHGTS